MNAEIQNGMVDEGLHVALRDMGFKRVGDYQEVFDEGDPIYSSRIVYYVNTKTDQVVQITVGEIGNIGLFENQALKHIAEKFYSKEDITEIFAGHNEKEVKELFSNEENNS